MIRQENPLLFLDFDDVLNSHEWYRKTRKDIPIIPGQSQEDRNIDELAVKRLNRIIHETNCDIVISSSWRKSRTVPELREILVKKGLHPKYAEKVIDKTPNLDTQTASGLYVSVTRGTEITSWIERFSNPNPKFAILDDDDDMENLMEKFIQTDPMHGLTDEKAKAVIELLQSQQ